MKKHIFIMAAAAMALTAGAVCAANGETAQAAAKTVAINKKNFPDEVFREFVRLNYDKNKDKKLSAAEIKKAKEFGTGNCKLIVKIKPSKYAKYQRKFIGDIKSFKGLEKLTNMRKFSANMTSVKTINLKKLKNLTYFEMENGRLQKLDLNSNRKLKFVYLAYNQLTSLKISKCHKLLDVDLTGHMVKKLKIFYNKNTKVSGKEYCTPLEAKKIKTSFSELNNGGCFDANGQYCVYEWKSDYSGCTKNVLNNTAMTAVDIVLDANTIAKTKAMQDITAQWQDDKGNFYFIADKNGDMVAKSENYLYKVNAQGAIEKEIELNQQINFSASYENRYNLYFLNQKNGVATLGMLTAGSYYGVIYFDMNKMVVTKQVECNFQPTATEGDTVVGIVENGSGSFDVFVSKITKGTMMKLENGTELEVCKLSSTHNISVPYANGEVCAVTVKNDYVYVLTTRGFFKAKLTAQSVKQIYNIGKISELQDYNGSCTMTMVNEKEIYLLFKKLKKEKAVYSLEQCKIK